MEAGIIINNIEIPKEDVYRIVFSGDKREHISVSFKATAQQRGIAICNGAPAGSTSVRIISEGEVVYEKTGFTEVNFEMIFSLMGNKMAEQVSMFDYVMTS